VVSRGEETHVETKEPTRELLAGIAGDGSLHFVNGSKDAILGAFSVAFTLGLLVLDVALCLTFLAGRLERLETGDVADLLFHLSQGILDGTGGLAVNERNVSKRNSRGSKRGDMDEPWIRRHR
jgi:hypothetical protein